MWNNSTAESGRSHTPTSEAKNQSKNSSPCRVTFPQAAALPHTTIKDIWLNKLHPHLVVPIKNGLLLSSL